MVTYPNTSPVSTRHDEFLKEHIGKKISLSFISGSHTAGILRCFDDICIIITHTLNPGDVGKEYDSLLYRRNIESIQ